MTLPPAAPAFQVVAVDCFERPVTLRLPFRFGAATVHEAPQAFVRARIVLPGGRAAEGWTAELMIPKWFDKDPAKSNAQNIDALRAALGAAAQAYVAAGEPASAFGHAARHYAHLLEAGGRASRNALTSSYGAALVDRAILDALCRGTGVDFASAVRANVMGLDAGLTPDLAGFALDAFCAALAPRASIAARYTVGLADPLTAADARPAVADDLPVTLEEAIARDGYRAFKLKLCGDVPRDLARLAAIAAVLEPLPAYQVTLDGNEQYAGIEPVRELAEGLRTDARLQRLNAAVGYLEQPLPRDETLVTDVHGLAGPALLIDEADATLDAFVQARALGYAGVSSKDCKGVYKSLLNAARVARWNAQAGGPRCFISGEDLTCQAGLAVQQDLALVGLLGLPDVERNGHHYVDGFAGEHASAREAAAFLAAHPDLYAAHGDNVRLRVRDGRVAFGSLWQPGFASGAHPDVASLAPMSTSSTDPSWPREAHHA
jgi:hypothetical protein